MRYLAGFGVHAQASVGGLSAEPSRDRQGAELAADAGLGGPALLAAGGPPGGACGEGEPPGEPRLGRSLALPRRMFAHGHLAAGGPPGGSPVIGSPMFLHGDSPLTQQVPSRGTAREASAELGSCCCVKGLTRSTMMTTDTSATVVSRVAYTAFGDPVTPDGQGGWRVGWPMGAGGIGVPPVTRYQYAGGWGYESGAWGPGPGGQGAVGGPLALWGENPALPPVTLQHVGWRWYQPSIGRFVQRDPIGIRGGLNVYAYVENDPLADLDPDGLGPVKTPHGWRDPATGRWTRPPWLHRKLPKIIRWAWVYEGVKAAHHGLYCVMGEPYPGDPLDQLGDLLEQLKRLEEQNGRNQRQRGGRPDVFPPAPRRDPPACMGHVL